MKILELYGLKLGDAVTVVHRFWRGRNHVALLEKTYIDELQAHCFFGSSTWNGARTAYHYDAEEYEWCRGHDTDEAHAFTTAVLLALEHATMLG